MKTNNTTEKATKDAKKLSDALKEATAKSIKDILKEAIDDMIEDADEDEDENDYEEVVDGAEEKGSDADENTEKDEKDSSDDKDEKEDDKEDGEKADAEDDDAEGADDEWSDLEQFKVGDDAYDFSDADGDLAINVYNKLGDDDQIIIKKEDDGTFTVNDEETGAEYTIEINGDGAVEDEDDNAEEGDDFLLSIDDEDDAEGDDFEVDLDADGEEDGDIELTLDDNEDENNVDEMNEDKNFMVNDYQKSDPIQGLNMNEPADSKVTYSMDDGAPKGTERPYGKGAGDGQPFEQNVNECDGEMPAGEEPTLDEGSVADTLQNLPKMTKSQAHKGVNGPHRETSDHGKLEPYSVNENTYNALKEQATKIYQKALQIQEENKQYKNCITEIKKSLKEAAVLNMTLSQLVKLLSENTTTMDEKKSIVERFSNVTTLKESKNLYETIKKELNENKKPSVVLENTISADPTKQTINETTIYTTPKNPVQDLMDRMDNLYKH